MTATAFTETAALQPGATLPPLNVGPITRADLALYAGASGDHNPIHIDIDFAKAAGLPDVIAHGMLSMAFLARLVTNWAPQPALRALSTRFTAMTQVGAEIKCEGRVTERFEADGETRLRLALTAKDQSGAVTLDGEAVIAIGAA
ncbi:MAG: MaoC family dehydratase [Pseudomonadota bacterium]